MGGGELSDFYLIIISRFRVIGGKKSSSSSCTEGGADGYVSCFVCNCIF